MITKKFLMNATYTIVAIVASSLLIKLVLFKSANNLIVIFGISVIGAFALFRATNKQQM